MEKMCVTKPLDKTVSLGNKWFFFLIFCLSLTVFSVTTIMATLGHVTEGNENEEKRGKLLH